MIEMIGRYIKQKTVNILQGCCRLLVFFIVIGPVIGPFLDPVFEGNPKSESAEKNEASSIMMSIGSFWKVLANVIEIVVCFIVMADCIVIDSISYEDAAMNQTFLQLFKLQPLLLRGLLYLVVSGIDSSTIKPWMDVDNVSLFVIHITLSFGRKVLIIPAVVQILLSCFRYRKHVIEMQSSSPVDDPIRQRVSKFWVLTRYYEMEEYRSKEQNQTAKQRIGRACLLIPVILSLVSSCISVFVKFKVLHYSYRNNSANTVFNNIKFPNNTAMNVSIKLFQTQIFVPFISQFLLSFLFIIFIITCITRKKFVRFHNALKVLIVYNSLSAMIPTETLNNFISIFEEGKTLKGAMWMSILVPFTFVLPVLFYLCTHHPYKHVGDTVNGFKDMFQIISNLRNPAKLHKCVNTIMVILGLSGLFFLILSVSLPWMKVVFNPNKELQQLSKSYESLFSTLQGLESSGFIDFKTGLNKLRPVFKTPLLTFNIKFRVDIHVIIFILPCFLFGTVSCTIGFWRRQSVQGVSTRFILSTIAFSFFVVNVTVGVLLLLFKNLFLSLLRLVPLVDPIVTEQTGWKMMKLAFAFSSTAALILWLRTTGSFIIALVKILIVKCCQGKQIKNVKQKVQANKYNEINSSNSDISVISKSYTQSAVEKIPKVRMERDCHSEDKSLENKSSNGKQTNTKKKSLTTSTAWVMATFPALASAIIIAYVIIKRPSLFTATPEVTGILRSLLTETILSSDRTTSQNLVFKRDIADVRNNNPGFKLAKHLALESSIQMSKRAVPDLQRNISSFTTGLENAFISQHLIDIGGFLYVLNLIIPILCTFLIFLGFGLMAVPCLKQKHKKKIAGTLVFWILRLIIASLSFSQSIIGLIRLVFAKVPFFSLNIKDGDAVPLITIINVILLLSWIELRISKCKPIL